MGLAPNTPLHPAATVTWLDESAAGDDVYTVPDIRLTTISPQAAAFSALARAEGLA